MTPKFKLPYEPPKVIDIGGVGLAYAQTKCNAGGSPGATQCTNGANASGAQCKSGGLAGGKCNIGNVPSIP